jgi:hypothetical protein
VGVLFFYLVRKKEERQARRERGVAVMSTVFGDD